MIWVTDFRRPVNLIMLLIAVSSLAFAIFVYYDQRQVGEISYKVSRIKIFDRIESMEGISVSDRTGRIIDDNIFATEFLFWNSGNITVDANKIRNPLRIKMSGDGRVVDYGISAQSHGSISNFRVSSDPRAKLVREFIILWDVFDPGFAFKVRVIHTGNEESHLSVAGNIYQISAIADRTRSILEKNIMSKVASIIVSMLVIGTVFMATVRHIDKIPTRKWYGHVAVLFAITASMISSIGAGVGALWLLEWLFLPPSPPAI